MFEFTIYEYEDTQIISTHDTEEQALIALARYVITHGDAVCLHPHIVEQTENVGGRCEDYPCCGHTDGDGCQPLASAGRRMEMPYAHADYPHNPGTLYGCLACEYGECQCKDASWDGCVSHDCIHP